MGSPLEKVKHVAFKQNRNSHLTREHLSHRCGWLTAPRQAEKPKAASHARLGAAIPSTHNLQGGRLAPNMLQAW